MKTAFSISQNEPDLRTMSALKIAAGHYVKWNKPGTDRQVPFWSHSDVESTKSGPHRRHKKSLWRWGRALRYVMEKLEVLVFFCTA